MGVVRRVRGCTSRVGVPVCGRSIARVGVTCVAACVAVARSSKAVMVVVLLSAVGGRSTATMQQFLSVSVPATIFPEVENFFVEGNLSTSARPES